MQDEINEKAVNLAVQIGKLTAAEIKKGLEKLLNDLKNGDYVGKNLVEHKKTDKTPELKQGKQTLKQLKQHREGLSNLELTDPNLRLLYREMKKAKIDFSAVKDGKGKYILFFKGKDADEMTRAFNKYTQRVVKRANATPPIRKVLAAAKAAAKALNNQRDKVKNRSKGARDI